MRTSDQLRAARALIRWDQKDLAEKSGVSVPTIKRLEAQEGTLSANPPTLAAIRTALEAQGITFLGDGQAAVGEGVSLALKDGK